MSQINDLNERIVAFFDSRPYEVVADLNADRSLQIWRYRLKQRVPRQISIVAGEILHNLRTPLDQLLCAIAVQHCGSKTGVSFPFGETIEKFETALAKQKKLPPDAIDLIRQAKPYPVPGGNDLLFALHWLNIGDKHHPGLVPISLPGELKCSYLVFWSGMPRVIGPKSGQHLILDQEFTEEELAETGEPLAIWDARPGHLTFGNATTPGDETMEFMTTTPGAKFETDMQPALSLALRGCGLDGQPIVDVLNDMRGVVERVLLAFEKRFFS